MLIPREKGHQDEERRDADVEECNTERPGMLIPKESDADAEGERRQCRGRAIPMPNATR